MANQLMTQNGNGLIVDWPVISKPIVNLDLAPTIDFGMKAKTSKSSLDSVDSTRGAAIISLSPTYGPTFGEYTGSSPICVPTRIGILTDGYSENVAKETEDESPSDALVAVVIALLMLGAMASRIL